MTDYERIERVIRYLDTHYREQPSLGRLARVAGLSESHFHRLFTRWAGISPKSFLKFLTASHAKALLRESRDLLAASWDSGLSGPGRLHDLIVTVEGVTPGEFKSGGKGIVIRYGAHETPLGRCFVGVTERGICHLAFLERSETTELAALRKRWPFAELRKEARETRKVMRQVFGPKQGRPIRLLLKGTPFQIKVWEALLRVPPGSVAAYKDIARELAIPQASRAVGTAIAANAIALLIPCHRVIRETGAFGNYRWGSERKRALLARESGTRARRPGTAIT